MANGKKTASKKKVSKKKTSSKRKELQVHKENEIAIPQSSDPAIAMIHVIERIALNPDVDVDKMEKVMALQERMMDRQAEAEFNSAMTMVQANMPLIPKDGFNKHTESHYSKHETIVKIIKPIYTKEGFAVSFSEAEIPQTESKQRLIKIIGVLRHRSGHSETYFTILPIDDSGIAGSKNKTGVQGTGSTITYGRRYLTCMIFDVATGDDTDGNALDGNVSVVEEIIYISEEQSNSLYAKIDEHGVNKTGFYKWLKSEMKLTKLEDVPANRFDHVNNRIDSAIRAITD